MCCSISRLTATAFVTFVAAAVSEHRIVFQFALQPVDVFVSFATFAPVPPKILQRPPDGLEIFKNDER
jgi:hypothetical protein